MGRLKILCVDDQYGIRILLQEMLKDEYEVMTAEDGSKAMEIMKTFKPDAVILDMKLKNKKGTDVLREIRQIDSNIASAMLTAYTDSQSLEEIEEVHPDMIFQKPFEVDDLKSKIRYLVSQSYIELACS